MRDKRHSKTETHNLESDHGVFQLFGLWNLNLPKVKYNNLTEASTRLLVYFFRKKKQVRDLLLSPFRLKSDHYPLTPNPHPLICDFETNKSNSEFLETGTRAPEEIARRDGNENTA
ncbi:hypothetical protein LEP1GSC036_1051 [Leptospira weilii str. 2006001853]|uniref:Uncharacterized protein n=1 Tax=Leptospira weilii str. 2006001853 TaxID=1001589 RepID=A0A828Z650_9LEPT|nr:hypothetical protein LEP1GSC036_1051 [Leptospira weilii str. 2006001853]